jgi:hypothetical protein
VAISLVVLIGMVAFAVDVGALYAERRELQSAADARVLAIAEDCARGTDPCDYPTALATAQSYADDNAKDTRHGIDELVLDVGAGTVSAKTSTVDGGSGATILAPLFAGVLGYGGSTVRADAAAAWGYPRSLYGALPLIFSDCEWEKFGPPPPLQEGPPYSGSATVIYFHGSEEACHASPSGQDLPGGFGWLETFGLCQTNIEYGDWVTIDPGASPSNDCSPAFMADIVGTVVHLPFFDNIVGTGNNATYHVAGFGALYVTGFNFGGQFKQPSAGSAPCSGSDRCIAGYFTKSTATDGEIGGENRGIVIVKLTG